MSENEKKQQGLQIELPQQVAQGEYANFAIITHGSSDFVVDFARVLPGVPKAQVCSRVILAPEHAKRLLGALQENIMRYEKEYGPIRIPNQEPRTIAPFDLTKGEAWKQTVINYCKKCYTLLNMQSGNTFSSFYIRWNQKIVVPLQPETPFCVGIGGVMCWI